MNVYKNIATTAGILLIIGTAAGILSLSVIGNINDPNYLIEISTKEDQAQHYVTFSTDQPS